MLPDPIKCAFVGLGRFAINKYITIANDSRVSVVGGVDLSASSVARFRRHVGNLSIPVFRSVKNLLANTNPDIILITSTAPSHVFLAKQVILENSSIPILIEKPISNILSDADDLVKLSEKYNNIRVGVDYPRRASKIYRTLKSYSNSGIPGTLKSIQIRWNGTIGMNGSHMFDLACMIVSSEIKFLKGDLCYEESRQIRGSKYKDLYGKIIVNFKNGCNLYLDLNKIPKSEQIINLIFDKGCISVKNNESFIETSIPIGKSKIDKIKFLPKKMQAYEDWISTMYSLISNDKSSYCSLSDSLLSMELVLASFIAHSKGKNSLVNIPIEPNMRNTYLPIA